MYRFLIILCCFIFTFLGCVKEQEKAVAFITVTSPAGFPQPKVFVNFYIASNNIRKGSVDTTLQTDIYGHCEYVRYQECFLDVLALKQSDKDSTKTLAGSISIRMIPGETVSKTIVIR